MTIDPMAKTASTANSTQRGIPMSEFIPVYYEPGSFYPCSICGKLVWVTDFESEMGEPKICSRKCAYGLGY